MVNRRRRSLGRWLAPLALITCVVAVYAVVDNTLLKDDSASTSGNDSTQKAKPTTTTSTGKAAKTRKRRRAYIVKSGDTLSAISVKTGVSLATIKRLNPKIDADTLHAGQRVRLSR
jgi:LysM repeat protein